MTGVVLRSPRQCGDFELVEFPEEDILEKDVECLGFQAVGMGNFKIPKMLVLF